MEPLRSALYQCLAEILADPPEWMENPGSRWPLTAAASALALESAAAREAVLALEKIGAEPLEARQERYAQLFSGPGKSGIALYESGALTGQLLSAETFAVERWYQQAGLGISGAEMPDHASVELAFLAFLSGCEVADLSGVEAAFLQQHAARWLPNLGQKIAASADPVYAPVGRLLAGWIAEVCAQLGLPGFTRPNRSVPPRRTGLIPTLKESEPCTLCSFCVSTCPSNALWIQENESTTALVLSIERCSGCGKCVRACPAHAIAMDRWVPEGLPEGSPSSAASADGGVILRQSPRAACCACGAIMISQAELDYVAACLNDPAWLAYCPDCRARYAV